MGVDVIWSLPVRQCRYIYRERENKKRKWRKGRSWRTEKGLDQWMDGWMDGWPGAMQNLTYQCQIWQSLYLYLFIDHHKKDHFEARGGKKICQGSDGFIFQRGYNSVFYCIKMNHTFGNSKKWTKLS